MRALFISDLHLTPECPAVVRAFCHYLSNRATEADALYILGDFFEYWVGDDAMSEFEFDIARQLRQYTDTGRPIYLMPGNRDFSIGKSFRKQAGITWLRDPTLVELNQRKILLLHGDSLCTLDQQYQRRRRFFLNPVVLNLLLLTPLSYRKNLGARLRRQSEKQNMEKSREIMDVTPTAVVQVMEKFQVDTLIHGHTHRPAIHDVALNQGMGKRYVLGDWTDKGWEIELNDNGIVLQQFPISN